MLMYDKENIVYLRAADQAAGDAEPDAIGIILLWANQMLLEGRMPEGVRVAFNEHFSFFCDDGSL
jgi:hypothetical protein